MSLPLIVRLRAEQDIAETGLWYERQRPGTARYFLRCVDAAFALIARHPEAAPIQFDKFRRRLVSRFPFGVFYTVETNCIVVHGVLHLSRDPDKLRSLMITKTDVSGS